jgi:ribosomal protein L37AE/L43A
VSNLNIIEGCSKEQPAGAETYVCGQPNLKRPNFPWYCRKCNKKYVEHLENRVTFLEDERNSKPQQG